MTSNALDAITAAFVGALQTAFGVLAPVSLALLGVLATISFYQQLGPAVMLGSSQVSETLGTVILLLLKMGIFYFILFNLLPLTTAAFQTFLTWGLSAGGGGFSDASLLQPSLIIDVGFRITGILKDSIDRMTGWQALWSMHSTFLINLAMLVILCSFAAAALHLVMVVIEFYVALAASPVLVPWGVFPATAVLAEFAIGWLLGCIIRVFLTTIVLGIGTPLFTTLSVAATPGGDPTFYGSVILAIASILFAILSWVIPSKAAGMAGRGLGLTGNTITAAAATGARVVMLGSALGQTAVRGASSLIRR